MPPIIPPWRPSAGAPSASACAPPGGRGLQEGDQVGARRLLLDAGEGHAVARQEALRVGEEGIERILAPDKVDRPECL
jgi:hypothetical protein